MKYLKLFEEFLNDKIEFSNWKMPSESQLKQEFRVEHQLKGNNFWQNEEEFLRAIKEGKIETITPQIDKDIENRSRTQSYDDLLSLIKNYRSYPKYRNENTLKAIYDGFKNNQPMDLPIIIDDRGHRRIFSGNTRMDISFQLEINPKALIVKGQLFDFQNESVDNEKTREDCLKKYGKILFDINSSEKNTDIEDKLIDMIKKFTVADHGKFTNPEFTRQLKDLSNCMSIYPSVLKPENEPIYRGTTITLKAFLMGEISDDVTISNYNYKPNSPISSWSPDSSIAKNFADNYNSLFELLTKVFDGDEWWTKKEPGQIEEFFNTKFNKQLLDERFGVILKVDKPDNTFLFNSSYFNKLSEIDGENELLKITNDPIKVNIIPYMARRRWNEGNSRYSFGGWSWSINKKDISQIKLVLEKLKTFL
jgi:hypothetical protein